MNQRINAHQFVYISLRFTRNRYKWLLPNNLLLQHKLISATAHALYVWKFLRINLKPLAATYSATNAWLIGARSSSNAQFGSNLSRLSNTASSLQMITKSILPLHMSFPSWHRIATTWMLVKFSLCSTQPKSSYGLSKTIRSTAPAFLLLSCETTHQ